MSTSVTQNKAAFVTGGSGFLGRELIAALGAAGYKVRALARSMKAAETVRVAGAEPVMGDLDDEAMLREGMAGAGVVFHSAALVNLWAKREDAMHVNVRGTERVLAAAKAAGVPRLVHVSSEAVLAEGRPIVGADETWPLPKNPVGIYPLTKGLAEQLVTAENGPALTTVIARPRFVWGRGDTSVLPKLTLAARRGQFLWIDGGRHRTSTCHVKNACEGLILAAERGRGGEAYFLTDGEPVEMRRFVTALLKSQGVDPGRREIPLWVARAVAEVSEYAYRALPIPGEPPITRTVLNLLFREVTVSDAKARRDLGYTARVSIAEGLSEMGTPSL
jgi:nucleoside-diphosphate-sugar epimerase